MESRTSKKKHALLAALSSSGGNISDSCRIASVGRKTYYRWIQSDPAFAEKASAIIDEMTQMTHGIQKSKEMMLTGIEHHKGNITAASLVIGISKYTHRQWYKEDMEYRDRVDQVIDERNERILDKAMEKWEQKIDQGDDKAIMKAIDKLGDKVGLIEKKQHEITTPGWMNQDNTLDEI